MINEYPIFLFFFLNTRQYLQNVTIFSELEFSLIQYPSNLSVLFLNDICKLIGKKVSSNGTDRNVFIF